MATVLCDPNYDPATLYTQVEPLLYLYEHVYLYGPSQAHIQHADLHWRPLMRLIEEGFVIPIGREFWFDPRRREERAKRAGDNTEAMNTYLWGELDEAILKLGPSSKTSPASEKRSPGYLILGDEHRRYAEEMEQTVPLNKEEEFRRFVAHVQEQRKLRRLPQEVLHGEWEKASTSRVAAKLVFYAAGDLCLEQRLGAASILTTDELGTVYRDVASSLASVAPAPQRQLIAVPDSGREYHLTPDQLDIAWRLAKQISSDTGPVDIDLLKDYRDTPCFEMFRDFVSRELALSSGDERNPVERANQLKKVFDRNLNFITEVGKTVGNYGPGVVVASAGFMAQVVQSLRDDAKGKKQLTRREVMRELTYDFVAALFARIFTKQDMGPAAEKVARRVTVDPYEKLFVIVGEARHRRERARGR